MAVMEPITPIPFTRFTRVLRGKDTVENLAQVFPAIEQKLLTPDMPPLTDHERRQLLDLPDADEEAENIKRIGTCRSREELILAAISNPDVLSQDELQLLSNGFWWSSDNDLTSADLKLSDVDVGKHGTPTEEEERIDRARDAADSIHHELEAFEKAFMAIALGQKEGEDEKQRAYYREQLQSRPVAAWMETLSQQILAGFPVRNVSWGYVAFLDVETQALGEKRLDLFISSMESVLYQAMMNNGACAHLLDRSWRLLVLNAPSGVKSFDDLRRLFRSLMAAKGRGREGPEGAEDGQLPVPTVYGDEGLSAIDAVREAPGLLDSTFLVIAKTCVDSVLDQPFLDDMRVVAVDADFTAGDGNGNSKDGGHFYRGWTWVRIEQLVNRFYGARNALESDAPRVGMYKIWEAAQASKNAAFVAMDPYVARVWTESTTMTGQEEPFYGVE